MEFFESLDKFLGKKITEFIDEKGNISWNKMEIKLNNEEDSVTVWGGITSEEIIVFTLKKEQNVYKLYERRKNIDLKASDFSVNIKDLSIEKRKESNLRFKPESDFGKVIYEGEDREEVQEKAENLVYNFENAC